MASFTKIHFQSFEDRVQFHIRYKTFKEWKLYRCNHPNLTFIDLFNLSCNVHLSDEKHEYYEKRLSQLFYISNKRLSKVKGGRQLDETLNKEFVVCVDDEFIINSVNIAELERNNREAEEKLTNLSKENCENIHILKTNQKELNKIRAENYALHQYIHRLRADDINPLSLLSSQRSSKVQQRQCYRQILKIEQNIEKSLWFLESFGFDLKSVTLEKDGKLYTTNEKESENENERVKDILHIMDRFGIGDGAYHELSMIVDTMPRSYLIRQERDELNREFNGHILRTPGLQQGVQVDVFKELRQIIQQKYDDLDENSDPIRIKISGDGAKMSRLSNFTIVSVCLLDDPMTVHPIAIIKAAESYEMLEVCLKDVFNDFNKLIEQGYIEIETKKIRMDVYFGGDYKFLLMVMGLAGANSHHACLWCDIHSKDRYDTSKPKDYYWKVPRVRTISDLIACAEKNKMCCKHKPLLRIPLQNIIADELHVMLRITDVLTNNLVELCISQDRKKSFKHRKESIAPLSSKKLEAAFHSIGISFQIWEKKDADGSGSGRYTCTSLTGDEKKKMLKLLPSTFHLYIDSVTIADKMESVWKAFEDIYETISKQPSAEEIQTYHSRAVSFINKFLSLGGDVQGFEKSRITPYMHITVYHIPLWLEQHGSLHVFTGQGVEKKNDDVRRIHLRKSSHVDSCLEAMQACKRLEALKEHKREKRKYHSSQGTDYKEARKKRKTIGVDVREDTKENLALFENWMVKEEREIKEKLKQMGVKFSARTRDKSKLVRLLVENM